MSFTELKLQKHKKKEKTKPKTHQKASTLVLFWTFRVIAEAEAFCVFYLHSFHLILYPIDQFEMQTFGKHGIGAFFLIQLLVSPDRG